MAIPTVSEKALSEATPELNYQLEHLSRQYGAERFRLIAQRYFKRQKAQASLEREIKDRQAELERLKAKANTNRSSKSSASQAARTSS